MQLEEKHITIAILFPTILLIARGRFAWKNNYLFKQ